MFFRVYISPQKTVVDNEHRTSNFSKHLSVLKVGKLEFPMKVKDFPKFEKLTNLNINDSELTQQCQH